MRRTGIKVRYSQGYNPHMLVNLTQPLVTGIKSLCEWASIDTDFDNEKEFIKLYNKACPEGLSALECIITAEKPKIAANVTASDYFIECEEAIKFREDLERVAFEDFIIEIERKGQTIKKDVRNLIHQVKVDERGIFARLSFGNLNLRIDKFAEVLNKRYGLQIRHRDITRQTQLIKQNNKYITVSQYLKGLR